MSSDPISDDDADAQRPPESYPGITPTQRAQMESGLIHVRSLVGDNKSITDRDIRESLWETYFDVEGTVEWFLEKREEETKAARKEKTKQKGGSNAVQSIVSLPTSWIRTLHLSSHFFMFRFYRALNNTPPTYPPIRA